MFEIAGYIYYVFVPNNIRNSILNFTLQVALLSRYSIYLISFFSTAKFCINLMKNSISNLNKEWK